MPHRKKALRTSPASNRPLLKSPEPPEDFWEQMERIHEEHALPSCERPPGFTADEYAKRYGMKRSGAHKRLKGLVKLGKLTFAWTLIEGARTKIYRPL